MTVEVDCDVFAPWDDEQGDRIIHTQDLRVCYCEAGKWSFDRMGDSAKRMATITDLLRDLFNLIDENPDVTWILPTAHPEIAGEWMAKYLPINAAIMPTNNESEETNG